MPTEWMERFAWCRRGTGVLVFDNQVGVGVDWELVQTVAGSLFLMVRANGSTALGATDMEAFLAFRIASRLDGLDEEGYAVRIECTSRSNPVHGEVGEAWVTIRASQVECVQKEPPAAVQYRFPLVNLSLEAPPNANWELAGARVTVNPAADYDRIVSTLYTRDRYAETALLTVETQDRNTAVERADAICELASYACGCRVQWLRLEGVAADGSVVSAWAPDAITGPFVPLPMIGEQEFWTFLQDQGASYLEFRTTHRAHARRLLGMLLNATTSDDFLELRGLKLAGAVDALAKIVLPSEEPPRFVSGGQRDKFLTGVRAHIREQAGKFLLPDEPETPGRQTEWIHQITEKAPELVRRSFRELIEEVCRTLRMVVESADTTIFIRARNELVHEGRFVSQRANPPADWPFKQPSDEYFWMLRFADRLVLRTLGYRGAFLDRSSRGAQRVDAELQR